MASERRKAWDREYQKRRRADPEKGQRIKEADRLRRQDPEVKAKRAERMHAWYLRNREQQKVYLAAWREANGDKIKAAGFDRYTKERHNEVPENGCEICGALTPGLSHSALGRAPLWRRDHDHANGLRRGLLCHPCNVSLGLMKDSPGRLRAAAEYLEAWAERHAEAPLLAKRMPPA